LFSSCFFAGAVSRSIQTRFPIFSIFVRFRISFIDKYLSFFDRFLSINDNDFASVSSFLGFHLLLDYLFYVHISLKHFFEGFLIASSFIARFF
jgi:hypothetical protein